MTKLARSLPAILLATIVAGCAMQPGPREGLARIDHIIVLYAENRSFDNLFGRFPGANGATVGVKYGREVPLAPCPHWLPGDLPHDRAAHLNDVNGGSYDGFGNGQFGDPWAYTTFDGHTIPNYWSWAKDYVLCDTCGLPVGDCCRDNPKACDGGIARAAVTAFRALPRLRENAEVRRACWSFAADMRITSDANRLYASLADAIERHLGLSGDDETSKGSAATSAPAA